MTTSYVRCAVCGARVFESATKDREYADMVREAGSAVLICASCAESYACKVEPHGLTPQELELKSVFDFIMEKYREAADEIQATCNGIDARGGLATGTVSREWVISRGDELRAKAVELALYWTAAFSGEQPAKPQETPDKRVTKKVARAAKRKRTRLPPKEDRYRLIHAYATLHGTVNVMDAGFMDAYIRATGATYRISDGGYPICLALTRDLAYMTSQGILEREVLSFGVSRQKGKAPWVYSYRVTGDYPVAV